MNQCTSKSNTSLSISPISVACVLASRKLSLNAFSKKKWVATWEVFVNDEGLFISVCRQWPVPKSCGFLWSSQPLVLLKSWWTTVPEADWFSLCARLFLRGRGEHDLEDTEESGAARGPEFEAMVIMCNSWSGCAGSVKGLRGFCDVTRGDDQESLRHIGESLYPPSNHEGKSLNLVQIKHSPVQSSPSRSDFT
jgi:hypothetical protein